MALLVADIRPLAVARFDDHFGKRRGLGSGDEGLRVGWRQRAITVPAVAVDALTSVVLTTQYTNLSALVMGSPVRLTDRHAKMRRGGYQR